MTDLEKYQKVNATETLKELADVIRGFGVNGLIQGRLRSFDSERMAIDCETYNPNRKPNSLTREFGIRQQAIYIYFYENV